MLYLAILQLYITLKELLLYLPTYSLPCSCQDKVFEDAKPVIAALKNKGISAIGAAGFNWGCKFHANLSLLLQG